MKERKIRIINRLDDNYVVVDIGKDSINVNDILVTKDIIDNRTLDTLRVLDYMVVEVKLIVIDTMKGSSLCKKYKTIIHGDNAIKLGENNNICNHLLDIGNIYHISNSTIVTSSLGSTQEVYKKLSK